MIFPVLHRIQLNCAWVEMNLLNISNVNVTIESDKQKHPYKPTSISHNKLPKCIILCQISVKEI